MKLATVLLLIALLCCAPLSCRERDAQESPTWEPQKPEFLAIAERLREGSNPYLGTGQLGMAREQIAAAAGKPLNHQLEARIRLVLELLKLGELDTALAEVNAAFALVQSEEGSLERFAFLYRARALVHLRRAEIQNCVLRHNADCCLFPLQGGGVHSVKEPAALALKDYLQYLNYHPHEVGARWLLNVTAMAVKQYPQGVPKEQLIPPSVFQSEYDIGRFVDVAPELGVDTLNLCGGTIVDDFDRDGFLDIMTSTFDPEGPLTYYRSQGDGTFENLSGSARTDDQLGGLNCIGGDYDNDGDLDVLVLRGAWLHQDGAIRNSLLRNNSDGTFTDVTRAAGLAQPAAPTQAAAWGDFDHDGDLDLYIGNEGYPTLHPSLLFRNNGDGTFTDIAASAKVTNDAYAKGVCVGDYDNDGDLDLYVSNFGPNRLYRNDGKGTFTDVATVAGVEEPLRSFATWFFDYDNDGWLDLFVAAYEAPIAAVAKDYLGLEYLASDPALYRNQGDGTFRNVTNELGLDHAYLPMGANFGDLDNDGYLDIYLATGDPNYESLMPNVMLRNDQGQRFQDVTTSGGLGHLQKGHGVSFADLDNDGDQDIYHQLGGFYRGDAFRNALFLNPGHGNHFLFVQLVGTQSNRAGYGARIGVVTKTEKGSQTLHRAVGCVSSFGGSPSRMEIGLGNAESIERLEVYWPRSKTSQVFKNVPMDCWIEVTEGKKSFKTLILKKISLGGG